MAANPCYMGWSECRRVDSIPARLIGWSGSEGLPEQRGQLVPLDEERVVALGRADLSVAGVHPGRQRRVDQRMDLGGPYRMSPSMPTPVRRVPPAASARKAASRPPRPSPTSWRSMRLGQDPIGQRVEPVDELAALVLEVADDRRPAVGLARRARTARRSRPRCGTSSSPAGGRATGRRGRAGR